MIKVINFKNKKFVEEEVFIGRGSIWGNPFKIGKDGTRSEVIAKFERYLATNKVLLKALPSLADKTLVCFCKPKPCHGDVLVKWIRLMQDDDELDKSTSGHIYTHITKEPSDG